jgi:hypothetical protein
VRDFLTAEDVLRRMKVVSGEQSYSGSQDYSEVTLTGFWEIKGAFGIHTHWHNH